MDFILEGFDTFLFDPIYATLFPATPYGAFKNIANATISSREIPTTFRNNFVYEPSSKYLSLTPSSYAYTTSWTRDDIGRQALSLFLITWYVVDRAAEEALWQGLKVLRLGFLALSFTSYSHLSHMFSSSTRPRSTIPNT